MKTDRQTPRASSGTQRGVEEVRSTQHRKQRKLGPEQEYVGSSRNMSELLPNHGQSRTLGLGSEHWEQSSRHRRLDSLWITGLSWLPLTGHAIVSHKTARRGISRGTPSTPYSVPDIAKACGNVESGDFGKIQPSDPRKKTWRWQK